MEVTIYLLSGMIQVKWLCDPLICICTYAMTDPWDFCICTYWFTIGHPNLWKSYPFASAFITSIIWLVFESRNAIQVFESSQISTCLSLCYSKNACFLLGKHPWCFKVGGPDDFLYLRISPAWTSHKSWEYSCKCDPHKSLKVQNDSLDAQKRRPPNIHPELLVYLPVKHSNGKLPVLIGDASSNGSFSVVMLVFWGEGLRSKRSPLKLNP